MKQSNYFTTLISSFSIIIIFFTGCSKEPDIPNSPVKGKWLLSEVYEERGSHDQKPDSNGPKTLIDQYLYKDGQNQPWLHTSHDPPRYPIESRDTFFYDQQHRVSAVSSVDLRGSYVQPPHEPQYRYFRKTIKYTADGKVDTIAMKDRYNFEPSYNSYRATYKYEGNIVTQTVVGTKGPKATIEYHYNNKGNIIARKNGPGATGVINYSHYDNCPNFLSFLNMNIYLPCRSRKAGLNAFFFWDPDNIYEPVISKNNYGVLEFPRTPTQNTTLGLATTYTYTLDANGLVTEIWERSPTILYWKRYTLKYIPAR